MLIPCKYPWLFPLWQPVLHKVSREVKLLKHSCKADVWEYSQGRRRYSVWGHNCVKTSWSPAETRTEPHNTFICRAEEGVNTDLCLYFSSTRWRPGLTWTSSGGARVPKGKVLIVSQACSNLPLWLAGCIHTTAVLSAVYKKNFPSSVNLGQCENPLELWCKLYTWIQSSVDSSSMVRSICCVEAKWTRLRIKGRQWAKTKCIVGERKQNKHACQHKDLMVRLRATNKSEL